MMYCGSKTTSMTMSHVLLTVALFGWTKISNEVGVAEGWVQPITMVGRTKPVISMTKTKTTSTALFNDSESSSFDIGEMPFFIASDNGGGTGGSYIYLEPDPETPTMELEESYSAKQKELQQQKQTLFRPDVQSRTRYPADDLTVEKDIRVMVPNMAKKQRSMLSPTEMPKSIPVPKDGLFEVSGTGYHDGKRRRDKEQQKKRQMMSKTGRKLPDMLRSDAEDLFDISGTGYDSKRANKERETKKRELLAQQHQKNTLPAMLQADEEDGQQQEKSPSRPAPPLTKRQQDLLIDRSVRVAFPSLERKKLDRTMMQPAAQTPSSFTTSDDLFKVDGSGYESEADKLRKKRNKWNDMMGIMNDDSTLPFNAQGNMMSRNKKTMAPIGGSMIAPASADELKGSSKPVSFQYENLGTSGNGGTHDGIGFTEVKQPKPRKQRIDLPTGKPVPFRQEGATDEGRPNPMWMEEDKPAPKPKQERFDLGQPVAFKDEGSTDNGRPNPMWLTEKKPVRTLERPSSASSLLSSTGTKPAKFSSNKPLTSSAKGFGTPSNPKTTKRRTTTETEQEYASQEDEVSVVDDDALRSEVIKAQQAAVDAIKMYAATTLAESQVGASIPNTATVIEGEHNGADPASIESILEAAGGIDEILKSDNPLAVIDQMIAAEVAKAEEEAQRQIEVLEAQKRALLNGQDEYSPKEGDDDFVSGPLEQIMYVQNTQIESEKESVDASTIAEKPATSYRALFPPQPTPPDAKPKPISSQQISLRFGRKVLLISDDDIYNKR